MKKVVTMLLCAVLLVSLLAVSVFAAEPYQFTITPAKTELVPGEEIKFNVTVNGTEDCDTFGLLLDFDRDVFEFVKGTCNPVAEDEDGNDLIAAKSFSTAEGKEGFAVSFLQKLTYSGRVGNFTLKVKEGVEFGSTTVTCTPSVKCGSESLNASVDVVTLTQYVEPTEAPTTEAPTTEPTEAPTEAPTEHVHTWVEYGAVEPTCDTEGNIAYKQCSGCGEAWSLGENPMPLGRYGWILSALGHTWVNHEAVAPTCYTEGNVAYQQCSVCGAAQTWEENPIPLTNYGWILGVAHTFEHHEAVEASCGVDGHYAFDYCTTCEIFVYEDPLMLSFQDGVIPALEHNWVAYEAVAPSCNAEGNIAYERCSNCGEARTVGENPIPLGLYGWVLGPTGEHTMEHHDAIEATCYEDGHYAYDYCTTCECYFYEDPLMLTYQAGVIPAAHTWVNHEAVAPTCFEPGNVAYQQCSVCGAAQTWEENPMPLSMYGWVLGPVHTIVHVEAVAPTYGVEGNIEYWYCSECGYAWTDANLTQVTNLLSVILPALETPATGDETPVVALIALSAMAVCGLALVMANKKRFVA